MAIADVYRVGEHRLVCSKCGKAAYPEPEAASYAALRIFERSGKVMRWYAGRCGWIHLTRQMRGMSKLATVLMELRLKAGARQLTWATVELRHGLSLAWRSAGEEQHLLLKRNGVMPSFVEQRVVLEHLPEELAPRTKTTQAERFIVGWVLRKHACPGCKKPLDALAKIKVRTHCSYCAESPEEKPCKRCGKMVPLKGTMTDWCNECVTTRRA